MRLFVDQNIQIGQPIQLDIEASHYIQHVLRFKVGASIFLFNGRLTEQDTLGEYSAIIIDISKKLVTLVVFCSSLI